MAKTKPPNADPAVLVAVGDYFKVLSEVSRLQILTCLKSGSMNVMEMALLHETKKDTPLLGEIVI
ncbi:transcriptional regulator [Nostoc sphaeroides CCNUC1]|uniref:Transcriptional regulator n=1 Tax=Nostoc sphaeroides CCNUC1 TaxID=2653204 RepID=A0A5P8VWZ2_9NOSO|nr:transcriptional regulator [Nostoc sphaeroides CCNUC1]